MVLIGKSYGYMFSKSWGTRAKINRHIEHLSRQHSYELGLSRFSFLKMQPS